MLARKIIYWLGLMMAMVLACSFQTVFWYQSFGHLSAPLLWLSVANYVILSRRAPQSLFWVYLLVAVASIYSSTSLGLLWLVIFAYYWAIVLFKNNFYMESTSYCSILDQFLYARAKSDENFIPRSFDSNFTYATFLDSDLLYLEKMGTLRKHT